MHSGDRYGEGGNPALPLNGHLLSATDPLIANALADEVVRQQSHIELTASENIVSRAVLDALGHGMNNKTLEGHPSPLPHADVVTCTTTKTCAVRVAG